MSVGILLITHDNIGSSLLESLQIMLGTEQLPLPIKVLPVRNDVDRDAFNYHAEQLFNGLNEGQGVLVLTDLFGATPCNVAGYLIKRCRVRVISGVNFPMLVKVITYPKDDLDSLANKALSGGCQGILDVNNLLNSN